MLSLCNILGKRNRHHAYQAAVRDCDVVLCRHEAATGNVYMAAQKFELSMNLLAAPAPGQH